MESRSTLQPILPLETGRNCVQEKSNQGASENHENTKEGKYEKRKAPTSPSYFPAFVFSFAAHTGVCLAGESPAMGVGCMPCSHIRLPAGVTPLGESSDVNALVGEGLAIFRAAA